MSCFSCCFSGTKNKNKIKVNKSTFLSAKTKEIMKFNPAVPEINEENKSPFRSVGKSLTVKDNIMLDPVKRKSDSNLPDKAYNEPLNNILTKQRFSHINQEILNYLKKTGEKRDSDFEKKKHWVKHDKFKCLFCGGVKCKHEDFTTNKNPAILGLHSDYITQNVVASQRPSTYLIEKYNLISGLKQANIGLIVNLQREGEHPYCGPNRKLEESGFTYEPHHFLSADIDCKISGWKDMSVPHSVSFILDIVKEMASYVYDKKKNILVHCHAGYGRTGVVIACYLIFTTSKSCEEIISEMRSIRPGCVQKKEQFNFCKRFYDFVKKSRILFKLNLQEEEKNPIEFFLKNQNDYLYGRECEDLKYIPKFFYESLTHLINLKTKHKIENNKFSQLLCSSVEWDGDHEETLRGIKKLLNEKDYQVFYSCENVSLIITLLYDWLEDDVEFLIKPQNILNLITDKFFFDNLSESSENQSDKKNRILIMKHLELSLMKREYEILMFISKFFEQFSPDMKEEKECFLDSLERFCLHLLGYKFVHAYSPKRKNQKFNLIKKEVNLLSNIIQLIINHMKYDDSEDYFSVSESGNSQKINSISKKVRLIQSNSISNFLKFSSIKSSVSPQRDNNYLRGNSLPQFDMNLSEINNLDMISQDKYLKKMYEALGSYFNQNLSRKTSPMKDNISEISSIKALDNLCSSFDNSVIKLKKIENIEEDLIQQDIISCNSVGMPSPYEICLESNKIDKYSKIYKPRIIINEDIDDMIINETLKKSKVSHDKLVGSDMEDKSNGNKAEFQEINYMPGSNNSIIEETQKKDLSESRKTENNFNLHLGQEEKKLQINSIFKKMSRKKMES